MKLPLGVMCTSVKEGEMKVFLRQWLSTDWPGLQHCPLLAWDWCRRAKAVRSFRQRREPRVSAGAGRAAAWLVWDL